MIAAGPPQGDRPLLQEGVCEAAAYAGLSQGRAPPRGEANEVRSGGIATAASLGEVVIAAGPSQGDRALLQEGVCEAASAASLGEDPS